MLASRSRWLFRSLALSCLLLAAAISESATAATIFGTGFQTETSNLATPVFDPTDYELGTAFQSSVAGDITGLRVYLGPVEATNPGTIVGTLWDAYGGVLGSAAFTGLAEGWNEVALSSSISILANTTYVVSANTNAGTTGLGAYADDKGPGDAGFFVGGGYVNSPLTATAGVFAAPGSFPTSSFPTTNGGSSYFRDVQFEAAVPIPEPSTLLLVSLGLGGLALSRRPST